MEIGQVVFSKCGRDKGRAFVVLSIEDEYVFLSDGQLRPLNKPKKKKIKHTQPTHTVVGAAGPDPGYPERGAFCEVKRADGELIYSRTKTSSLTEGGRDYVDGVSTDRQGSLFSSLSITDADIRKWLSKFNE